MSNGAMRRGGIFETFRRRSLQFLGSADSKNLVDFKLNLLSTKEATKEVARQGSALPLLWWRPKAATFLEAVNIVNIVTVKTVAREFPWDSLGRADSKVG